MIRKFVWLGFFIVLAVMGTYTYQFSKHNVSGITALEMAGKEDGKVILHAWESTRVHEGTLISTARSITRLDFLFIIFYTGLIIMLSNDSMQREKWYPLNMLLRMNIPVIILAALSDIIENILLFVNINNRAADDPYYGSYWITWIKFILAGVAVFVLLIAAIKRLFKSK